MASSRMPAAMFQRIDILTCFAFLLLLGLSQRFQLLPSAPLPEEFLPVATFHRSETTHRSQSISGDGSARGPRRRLLEAPSQAEDREAQRRMVRAAVERWRTEQRARDKREMNESMPDTYPADGGRFLLGPKITDWDEQRADYVRKHPGSNETRAGQPRVMLVTGSQPGVCDNDVGDFLLLKALKNKIDYCAPREIEIYYSTAILDRSMDSFWVKLPLLRKLMLSHAEVEWFWWMDSDAVFTDMMFDVPFNKYEPHIHMVMHGYDSLVYEKKDWVGLNAGIYLIRNSQWSLDFMEDLAQFGAKGPMRDAAGIQLFKELSTRPMFEGDDQSAIVWMMSYFPEKYGKHIFLESKYMLHSYWLQMAPHYEEMMDKYHPGYGDHRWPLITHFVGCKPCGKIGVIEYTETQKCVENMERAFNFADNQVLRKFGYEHLHLDTFQVVKINFTTYKASEFNSNPLKHRQLDF